MKALAPETRYSPDDLLRLEEEGLYELVDGRVAEKPMSSGSSRVAWIIGSRLFRYLEQSNAGECYPEQAFQYLPGDNGLVRRPDLAFAKTERVAGVSETGHTRIAPDLAIGVISPTDLVYDLDEKLADYKSAAIPLAWVAELSGDPVSPGFSVPVRDVFEFRAPAGNNA